MQTEFGGEIGYGVTGQARILLAEPGSFARDDPVKN